ncbi:hypothetical protein AB0C84_44650 [Actinomadura sp. NPDC048955]|uniref:hypothetical protein n=1 Tax=Actinomadura sp. NPDC048955 TaxID=3158228 RepID=UPI00340ABFE4
MLIRRGPHLRVESGLLSGIDLAADDPGTKTMVNVPFRGLPAPLGRLRIDRHLEEALATEPIRFIWHTSSVLATRQLFATRGRRGRFWKPNAVIPLSVPQIRARAVAGAVGAETEP